jgi:MFS superfamily sulfate permease-like transporter
MKLSKKGVPARAGLRASIILGAAVALAGQAYAGSSVTQAAVTAVIIVPSVANAVFIQVAARPTGIPTCSTDTAYSYAIDLSGAAGNQMYALLLSAMLAGKLVDFTGLGTCTTYSTVEDLRSVRIAQ